MTPSPSLHETFHASKNSSENKIDDCIHQQTRKQQMQSQNELFVALVRSQNVRLVKNQLEMWNASVNLGTTAENCPLFQACKNPGYVSGQELAILLLRYGCVSEVKDINGLDAFDWSMKCGNSEIVSYFAVTNHPSWNRWQRRNRNGMPFQVDTLRDISRYAVRKLCLPRGKSGNLHTMINKLNLPQSVRDYLLML